MINIDFILKKHSNYQFKNKELFPRYGEVPKWQKALVLNTSLKAPPKSFLLTSKTIR